jgi:arylsulfatase A-like enzyme
MRAVMVMFDSLNRHLLPAYGCDWTHAPNFSRLAERTATFDRSYVCSMPCMPARRDFHTGRPNFLHCPWGPLEPFDDSVPELLRDAGVYSHLASDHYHYWEDGGGTYHNRYSSWQFFRGQEGDPHIGQVAEPPIPANLNRVGPLDRSDWVNRQHTHGDADYPQTRTFAAGLEFLERNHQQQDWFLQLECFDPHEPFTADRRYRDRYPSDYAGPVFDWPTYGAVQETPEQVAEGRRNYAALLSKCDASLGDVLDAFDAHDLWHDTMLVVWTDHGFLLGEHGGWAKNWPPLYEEISHTPLFIWDPRAPQAAGTRRAALVQPAIDLGPTLLGLFGQPPTADMLGHDLAESVAADAVVRATALFGYFGQHVNITDGRYVYLRLPDPEAPRAAAYTLMTTAMRSFKPNLTTARLVDPLPFSKGHPLLRIDTDATWTPTFLDPAHPPGDLLFDLDADPQQRRPLHDDAVEARLQQAMAEHLQLCDAPPEQYTRMRLPLPSRDA